MGFQGVDMWPSDAPKEVNEGEAARTIDHFVRPDQQ